MLSDNDKKSDIVTDEELLRTLDQIIDRIGMTRMAKLAGVGISTVHAAVHGDRGVHGVNLKIAAALGYRPIRGWEEIPEWNDDALMREIEEEQKLIDARVEREAQRKAGKKPFIEIEE